MVGSSPRSTLREAAGAFLECDAPCRFGCSGAIDSRESPSPARKCIQPSSLRDRFSGPEMHTCHEPSSSRGSFATAAIQRFAPLVVQISGLPYAFTPERWPVTRGHPGPDQGTRRTLLLYRPERAAQVSLGQRPRNPENGNQSPEGATHIRLLKRRRGSRRAVNVVVSPCRTVGYRALLQGSGSTRCLPGALPQANLCCPVGAKSTAW